MQRQRGTQLHIAYRQLTCDEPVARFALHILQPHFFRVRYAGWLGNRFRAANLEMARTAWNVIPPKEYEPQPNVVDLEEWLSRELGDTTYRCPNGGEAKLLWESEIRGTVDWQRQRSQKPRYFMTLHEAP